MNKAFYLCSSCDAVLYEVRDKLRPPCGCSVTTKYLQDWLDGADKPEPVIYERWLVLSTIDTLVFWDAAPATREVAKRNNTGGPISHVIHIKYELLPDGTTRAVE